MMSLDDYLNAHFVDKATFAALAGISLERLDQLLETRAIPCATYESKGCSIESRVFGEIVGRDSSPGEYFRPECVRWARIADQASHGSERTRVINILVHELRTALVSMGCSPATLEAKIQDYLPAFFDGTYGLCVADPSSGAGIVRKETLQDRLTEITDNGSNPAPSGISRVDLLRLIDEYEAASMPFSPAEYPQSSRKRLVDDLRPTVANLHESR